MRLSTLALLLPLSTACAPAVVVAPTPLPPLEVWAQNHDVASRALGQWVQNHPGEASWMFEWDGNHPGKAREIVEWALVHPGESIPIFAHEHPDMPNFDGFAMGHVVAVHMFLLWCLHFPEAARSLVAHSGGLHWAGYNLYRAQWQMDHPGA